MMAFLRRCTQAVAKVFTTSQSVIHQASRSWRHDQSGCGLNRQCEAELLEEQRHRGVRVRVPGEGDLAPIRGREVHVDHREGPERLQHRAARQPGREIPEPAPERGVERVRQEGDEDVGFDPRENL